MPGLRQEPLRLLRVEVVEPPALGRQLVDGKGPVLEGRGNGRVGRPTTLRPRVGLEHLSPVGGDLEGSTHAEILEGILVELRPRDAPEDDDVVLHLQIRLALLGRLEIAPAHDHPVLGGEIVAAGQPHRQRGGGVGLDRHLDVVDVGQPGDEVVGVAHPGASHVGLVALEHPRSRSDAALGPLEVAVLLHGFLGDDPRRG